jgi:predicted DNA-binding protein YlxM (UPF0122 family)
MTKVSIGIILSELISEANLSAIYMADRLGKSRQQVYMDLKRTSMRDKQIEEYAKALEIDKQVIYDRMESTLGDPKNADYLQKYMQKLEDNFRELREVFAEELSAKNRQIEKLMDLLGKLNPDSDEPKIAPFIFLKNAS